MTGEHDWLWWALAAAIAVLAAIVWWVWRKGRPFADGDVFVASRFSRGNHLFPTQVAITPTNVVQFKPRWLGRQEETIHIAHIASVKIDTGLLFSNLLIETSGGTDPIACHGHRKADAVRMKDLIGRYQTDHFQVPGRPVSGRPAGPVDPGPIGR